MRFSTLLRPIRSRWWRRCALLLLALLVVATVAWRWGRPIVARSVARGAFDSDNPYAGYQLLLGMDRAGIDALIDHACDPDPTRAGEARRAIHTRVDAWRATTHLGNRSVLRARVEQLILLLESHAERLTESGVGWGERLAKQLLDLTDHLSPADRLPVIRSIDHMLAVLDQQPLREDATPAPVSSVENSPPTKTPKPRLSDFLATLPAPAPAARTAESVDRSATERTEAEPPRAPLTLPTDVADAPKPLRIAQSEPARGWTPSWQKAAPGAVPTPAQARPAEPRRLEGAEPGAEELAKQTDRELFAELLASIDAWADRPTPQASGPASRRPSPRGSQRFAPNTESIRNELAGRGYTGLRVSHLRSLLSSHPHDRIALVDQLLTEPSGDTPRWLLLLASDPSIDVRLAAVQALGASNQRLLVEAAWSIALREQDPRFAAVADQLGSRLR